MTIDEYVQFLRDRITALRIRKDVSEYEMSRGLDKSSGYIQSITSGKILPSIQGFFSICKYFEISPKDFFDTGKGEPALLARLTRAAEQLPPGALMHLTDYAEWLSEKSSSDDCTWDFSLKK